jgi:hypothetical protein
MKEVDIGKFVEIIDSMSKILNDDDRLSEYKMKKQRLQEKGQNILNTLVGEDEGDALNILAGVIGSICGNRERHYEKTIEGVIHAIRLYSEWSHRKKNLLSL